MDIVISRVIQVQRQRRIWLQLHVLFRSVLILVVNYVSFILKSIDFLFSMNQTHYVASIVIINCRNSCIKLEKLKPKLNKVKQWFRKYVVTSKSWILQKNTSQLQSLPSIVLICLVSFFCSKNMSYFKYCIKKLSLF